MSTPSHVPVLLDRVVALLAPSLQQQSLQHDRPRPPVMVDATLGLGGHTEAVLTRLELARVVGIDRDPAALELARTRLAGFGDRFTAVHAVYDELPVVLEDLGLSEVDAVLFDLGVSSMQLDVRERGFAYAEDAPLDMRMDASAGPTAADVLNTYSAEELTRVLREYGEERFARRIATAVVRGREQAPFTTSARLVELLYEEIPAPARRTGGHPAKRTFQALRMEVNDELGALRRAIPAAIDAISVGGRVVVESYHSLEDRLVKQAFAQATRSEVPVDLPFVPEGSEPALKLVTRGAERADAAEIEQNPRAASVRLRAVERVRAPGGGSMSALRAAPLRERVPRFAEAAVARARLTVVPRPRKVRAPKVPFVTLVSLVLIGGVVGLLCFNTQMQQASFAATSLQEQAANLSAREQTLHDELQALRDPQHVASLAQHAGMVIPETSCILRLSADRAETGCSAATNANTPTLLAKPPVAPAFLNPAPHVVVVPATSWAKNNKHNKPHKQHKPGRP